MAAVTLRIGCGQMVDRGHRLCDLINNLDHYDLIKNEVVNGNHPLCLQTKKAT